MGISCSTWWVHSSRTDYSHRTRLSNKNPGLSSNQAKAQLNSRSLFSLFRLIFFDPDFRDRWPSRDCHSPCMSGNHHEMRCIPLFWGFPPWQCMHTQAGRWTGQLGSFWVLGKNQPPPPHPTLLLLMLPHDICLIRPPRPYICNTDLLPDTSPPKGRPIFPIQLHERGHWEVHLLVLLPAGIICSVPQLLLDSSIWKWRIRKREKRGPTHLLPLHLNCDNEPLCSLNWAGEMHVTESRVNSL